MGSAASEPAAWDDEFPEHDVTVSPYSLDRFEVTVDRFKNFVENWDYHSPPPGAGAHPRIANSGWRSAWNEFLPVSPDDLRDRLTSCGPASTWSLDRGDLPINCVAWFEAFAFCAWDGGRLPTEAEWEYAAAGGEENRKYPWGAASPNNDLAVFECGFGGSPGDCTLADVDVPVGTAPSGAGRWGHQDLAGSMWEWVLDVHKYYRDEPCDDCAACDDVALRVVRGGSWRSIGSSMRAALRSGATTYNSQSEDDLGFRCARTP